MITLVTVWYFCVQYADLAETTFQSQLLDFLCSQLLESERVETKELE